MKNKIKSIISLMIILLIILCSINFKVYAVEDNNYVNANQESTVIDEYNRDNGMIIEVERVEAGKKCENKEVSVNINIKNANYISGGTLKIAYDSELKFIDIENKNDNYSFQVVNNTEESIAVIAFSSTQGEAGDFKVCSLKFKLPEKIEEEYYNVSLEKDTNLITASKVGNNYKLFSAVIHCEKSTNMSFWKIILIVIGVILIIIIL